MKTYSPKPEQIDRRWYVVDASGQVLGRLASEVATLLRGKHKPMYAPHMDTGDHVIVVNADKVELTGGKATQKYAYHHSGYPGGLRAVRYDQLLADRPVAAVQKAVRGMLPKNRLGRQMIKKLHVVAGPEHPHAAQKPIGLAVGERPAWDGLPVLAPAAVATRPATAAKAGAVAEAETSEAPAAKKPTAKKPTAKKPTAKKPTAKKPTAEAAPKRQASAKKTTARKSTSKAVASEPAEAPDRADAPAETETTEE